MSFNYNKINTDMLRGVSDKKILKYIKRMKNVSKLWGYGYLAEALKRYERLVKEKCK